MPRIGECSSIVAIGSVVGDLCGALGSRGLELRQAAAADADVVVLLHALGDDEVGGAFESLSALAARTTRPRVLIAVGTESRESAAIEGLVKTAAQEWAADWLCLTIATDADVTIALADELAYGGGAREVWLGVHREEKARLTSEVGVAVRPLPPGPWVVSGGARGVTAACCLALARAGMRQVLLLGRSAPGEETAALRAAHTEAELKQALIATSEGKPNLASIQREARAILARREMRATIDALEAAGVAVRYAAVDVADVEATTRAIDEARRAWGPMRGVVHAAGVLADKRLGEKTREQFDAVMRTKVGGAQALLAACGDDPLEVLCFFSSVAAHSGNVGQSDYAAANATLDRWAEEEAQRRGGACRVVSIAWGPWAGGMVTPSLAQHFTAQGIGLIPVADGAQAFVEELQRGTHVQVVLGRGLTMAQPVTRTTVRFDVERAPYLRDHAIGGHIVVPMTLALDWLLAAGRRELGLDIELRDLAVLKGAVLDDEALDLVLVAGPSDNADERTVTLTHLDGRLAYRATVARSVGAPPVVGDGAGEQGTLPACCVAPYDEALFHGPAFRVIRRVIRCDAREVAAHLATSAAMGWPTGWQLDPAALDGALQLLRLWGWADDGRASLPTAIGRCRTWGEWPASGEVLCRVTPTRDNTYRLRGDALFTDSTSGRALASIEGIVMHVQGG